MTVDGNDWRRPRMRTRQEIAAYLEWLPFGGSRPSFSSQLGRTRVARRTVFRDHSLAKIDWTRRSRFGRWSDVSGAKGNSNALQETFPPIGVSSDYARICDSLCHDLAFAGVRRRDHQMRGRFDSSFGGSCGRSQPSPGGQTSVRVVDDKGTVHLQTSSRGMRAGS